MTSAQTTIAIAGAGIGGLSAALALARQGITSSVYERRGGAIEVGAGIQLGPNATGVLAQLGVLDAVRAVAAEPEALSIHDGTSGRVLARFPLGAWMRVRHGAPYLTLHRQDLHRALLTAVENEPCVAVTYDRGVTGYDNHARGVDVRFGDGASQRADALIAADGLWSALRAQVSGSAIPQPTAKCAYRAVLASSALPKSLAANDVHIWLAPGAHVVHYPVSRGDEVAVIVVVDGGGVADGWGEASSACGLDAVEIETLACSLRDLIGASAAWGMWRLHILAPLQHWVDGAAALLGDAAHPVLPFFAQGGGLAIEDAAVLAQSLACAGPVADRLRTYEAARRPRAQRVTEASVTNGRIYHLTGPAAALRNAVLATVPDAFLMRRYDWLYGWTP